MGTAVTIDVRGCAPPPQAISNVVGWLHDVDAAFSTYRADSAVRRLDRGELELTDASPDVRWVIGQCERLRRHTGGFFDARATGTLDPSAFVKGWAVQSAADQLRAEGVADFCLTAGGDVATGGRAGDGSAWRVGVQHPRDRGSIATVVQACDNLAIATSGAYERGEHILDPTTGRPPQGVISVTVVGPDLAIADAYSTAAFAMGAAGPAWTLGLHGYEAMTIRADDVVLSTPGFPAVVA
jgi:thiamine biosynthesis lipoprotein